MSTSTDTEDLIIRMNALDLRLQAAIDIPTDVEPMLLWTDPPFGTGKEQKQGDSSYFDNKNTKYVTAALAKWTEVMHPNGVMAVCVDYRLTHDVHNAITACGWINRGEIIWEFGLGRPRTSWWPNRHNTITTFTRTETSGLFDKSRAPRSRRLAPKPGYAADKPAGSAWEYTMSNTHDERVGYPNQKPLCIVEPFVLCHTAVGDTVADPFMGSGTTGVAAVKHGRFFYGGDTNPDALTAAKQRIGGA